MFRVNATSLWLPILSGILLTLTLPYYGVWPLIWVALVPLMIFATNSAQTKSHLIWGMIIFSVIYGPMVVHPLVRITDWWWGPPSPLLGLFGEQVIYILAVLLVGCVGELLFILPLVFLLRYLKERSYGPLFIAMLWALAETLRTTFMLFGFSWGVLGYTLIDTKYIKHLALIHVLGVATGVYTLSVLVVLGNLALYQAVSLFNARAGGLRERIKNTLRIICDEGKRYASIWSFVLLFTFAFFFGVYNVFYPVQDKKIKIAVLAANISPQASIGEGAYRAYRAKLVTALKSGTALIVLPENSFPFFEINEADGTLNEHSIVPLNEKTALYADFVSLISAYPDVTVATGLHTTDAAGKHYNAIAFYKGGKPAGFYHKRKLIPYAEYVPFGHIFIPDRLSSGNSSQTFALDDLRIGALLCSEVTDTTISSGDVSIIISPSNDSVFSGVPAKLLHHQMSRMRALESGAYLLRASNGGISSVIDPHGNVVESSSDGVLIADITVKR